MFELLITRQECALISEVFAEDDKWIDGITYRIKGTITNVDFFYKSKQFIGSSSGDIERPKHLGKPLPSFPIGIELKENLMNAWAFRQAYIDWTFNDVRNNLYPNANVSVVDVSQSKKYLRHNETIRTELQNSFFNSSDKEFTNANPNWTLSADLKYSALMLGYYWGIFYPAYNGTHRWFKLGYGLGIFASKMKVDYNLCSRYEYTTKTHEIRNPYKTGECVGKHKIDQLEVQGVGPAILLTFTIWERKTKDSIWRFFNVETGKTNISEDQESAFALKKHDTYFVPKLELMATTFSYTSRF